MVRKNPALATICHSFSKLWLGCEGRGEDLSMSRGGAPRGFCEFWNEAALDGGWDKVQSKIACVNPSRKASGSSVVNVGIGMDEAGRASTAA